MAATDVDLSYVHFAILRPPLRNLDAVAAMLLTWSENYMGHKYDDLAGNVLLKE